MNKLNQTDPLVIEVMTAIKGEQMDQEKEIAQILLDMFFDTCSAEMVDFYEKECGLIPLEGQSLADRLSAITAKWISENKCDINLLQNVADSWQNGKVNVKYEHQVIKIEFIDKGIPTDLIGLKQALEDIKPAHLPVEYIFLFNTWRDVRTMKWSEAKSMTWKELKER